MGGREGIDWFTGFFDNISEGLYKIIQFAFGWINIPQMPNEITNSIDSFFNLIFDNLSLLGFFVRPMTLKIVIPVLIILLNFDLIYKIVMWLVLKIPFFNIK